MLTKSIPELHAELHLFRRAHYGAVIKAQVAYPLVERLQAAGVFLPRDEALERLAHLSYFSAGSDASESFESVEAFQDELTPQVEAAWPAAVLMDGQQVFPLQPFFNPRLPYFSSLEVAGLHGHCAVCELDVLNVTGHPLPSTQVSPGNLEGLTTEELIALVAFHHAKALAIVNALRHLSTSLNYIKAALARVLTKWPAVRYDAEIPDLVDALTRAAALPFAPAPASHFGTDTSRTNPLASLQPSAQALACLLEVDEPRTRAPETIRVLISNRPGGFTLAPVVLNTLFERSPEYFSELSPAALFEATTLDELDKAFPNSVIHGDQICFLDTHVPAMRTDEWLLEQFDLLGSSAMVGECCRNLKAVAVPASATWLIYEFENGAERVQEPVRSWG
jgi:hypothetical protein